eukprot:CAMPEP_0177644368 /NCGR_PEP_ID=MMETSP0447-20121125/8652_1 /TAXON_ID=0 /ORGANISM="Stygamoeba regulata, Strain BSH-02190019" /LENGTH=169 /DNA_ID=CAMNT_0019146727 /DNA_START=237 /DNA_END=743 /DNA_ORIENTATION=+
MLRMAHRRKRAVSTSSDSPAPPSTSSNAPKRHRASQENTSPFSENEKSSLDTLRAIVEHHKKKSPLGGQRMKTCFQRYLNHILVRHHRRVQSNPRAELLSQKFTRPEIVRILALQVEIETLHSLGMDTDSTIGYILADVRRVGDKRKVESRDADDLHHMSAADDDELCT